jgi:hypothetical protein
MIITEKVECWFCKEDIEIFKNDKLDPPDFCPNCLSSIVWDNNYDCEGYTHYWIHDMKKHKGVW